MINSREMVPISGTNKLDKELSVAEELEAMIVELKKLHVAIGAGIETMTDKAEMFVANASDESRESQKAVFVALGIDHGLQEVRSAAKRILELIGEGSENKNRE